MVFSLSKIFHSSFFFELSPRFWYSPPFYRISCVLPSGPFLESHIPPLTTEMGLCNRKNIIFKILFYLFVILEKSCDKMSNYELWKNDINDDTLNSVPISCKRRTRYLHKLSGKQRVKKRKVSSSKSQSIWDALLSTFSYLKINETTEDTLLIPGDREIEDDIELEFCSEWERDAADNWTKGEKRIQSKDCREAQEICEQDSEVKVPKTYKDFCAESQIMAIPCKTESFIDYEANDIYFDCE